MAGSELLESCSADGCCLTTAGAGAVTGLNMLTSAKIQTLELTRVNGSAMVPAGCGCGPSADSSAAGHECNCKSGVDVENYFPVEQVTAKRVDHKDAFVANDEFRSNEDQVSGQDEESRPQSGCCGGSDVASQPSFNGHNSADKSNDCCVGVATSRSEGLFISHKPIMAGDK